MEFCRQEYWSGWPLTSPGDHPDPEMEPGSPALQADSFPPELPGSPSLVECFWWITSSPLPSMVAVRCGSAFVGFCPCCGPWSSPHALLPSFPGRWRESLKKKKYRRKINNSPFSLSLFCDIINFGLLKLKNKINYRKTTPEV